MLRICSFKLLIQRRGYFCYLGVFLSKSEVEKVLTEAPITIDVIGDTEVTKGQNLVR